MSVLRSYSYQMELRNKTNGFADKRYNRRVKNYLFMEDKGMLNELSYGEVFSRFPDRYNVCNVCQRNQTNGFAEKYEILKNTTEKEIALEAMQYYQCEGFTELILIPTFDNGEERMTPKECAAFFRTYYYKQSDEFC